jgi:hypothetical protein
MFPAMSKGANFQGFDPKASHAYDPKYKPTKTLEQLVAENPKNQFLADRLAEQKAAEAKRRR